MPAPLIIFAVLAVLAVVLLIPTPAQHRELRARRPKGDVRLDQWAGAVRASLPDALSAQNVTRSGLLQGGQRPLPRIVGKGEPIEHGWKFTLDLPGASIAEDWDANRIVAALNSGRHLAAVGEIHHAGDGWATFHIHKREPLSEPVPIPWKPGELPTCCKPGTVCVGRQRDGQHIHFDIVGDVGAYASLIAGRRGSGKSETARLMVSQMVAWGWAPPTVIDLSRAGVDYRVFQPLLARDIVTTMADVKKLLDDLEAEAAERAQWLRQVGAQKIGRYTPERPLRPLFWDEFQDASQDKRVKTRFRSLMQISRPVGGAPTIITQYPTNDNVDSTTRAQITNVWSGRVRSYVESGVMFSGLPEGSGPHTLRIGPGGGMADNDGPDLLTGRAWFAPPSWHAAHVDRLAKRRVRVG